MNLSFDSHKGLHRGTVLLAPPSANSALLGKVETNQSRYEALLACAQRLRGKVYREIKALHPSQLGPDERHIQAADTAGYHLLTLTETGDVAACVRYTLHAESISYDDLSVSRSALAKSAEWGHLLRQAVEEDLASARRRRLAFVELGGWAITPALRCTTEAFRTMLSLYALSERFGGVLGITYARAACSAPILRRIGGQQVSVSGVRLPVFFDPQYHCDLEIIRFDSTRPCSKFQGMLENLRGRLADIPVICPA